MLAFPLKYAAIILIVCSLCGFGVGRATTFNCTNRTDSVVRIQVSNPCLDLEIQSNGVLMSFDLNAKSSVTKTYNSEFYIVGPLTMNEFDGKSITISPRTSDTISIVIDTIEGRIQLRCEDSSKLGKICKQIIPGLREMLNATQMPLSSNDKKLKIDSIFSYCMQVVDTIRNDMRIDSLELQSVYRSIHARHCHAQLNLSTREDYTVKADEHNNALRQILERISTLGLTHNARSITVSETYLTAKVFLVYMLSIGVQKGESWDADSLVQGLSGFRVALQRVNPSLDKTMVPIALEYFLHSEKYDVDCNGIVEKMQRLNLNDRYCMDAISRRCRYGIGQPFIELSLIDSSMKRTNLSDVLTHDTTIVYFWGTWCGACKLEMKEDGSDGCFGINNSPTKQVVFVAVENQADKFSVWKKAIQKTDRDCLTFLSLELTDSQKVVDGGIDRYPIAYMLDRKGRILRRGSITSLIN